MQKHVRLVRVACASHGNASAACHFGASDARKYTPPIVLVVVIAMAAKPDKPGSMVRAMALRVKYRVGGQGKESSKCCSVELLGPHPYNRGGAYPSGNHKYLFARPYQGSVDPQRLLCGSSCGLTWLGTLVG